MPFVVDASIVVAWALGEIDRRADAAHQRAGQQGEPVLAPRLWWYEVRNALIQNERRGRLTAPETERFLDALTGVTTSLDEDADEYRLLTLARRHRLTVYDASYLELALRRGLPLATLDADLAAAARAEGVPLIGDGG